MTINEWLGISSAPLLFKFVEWFWLGNPLQHQRNKYPVLSRNDEFSNRQSTRRVHTHRLGCRKSPQDSSGWRLRWSLRQRSEMVGHTISTFWTWDKKKKKKRKGEDQKRKSDSAHFNKIFNLSDVQVQQPSQQSNQRWACSIDTWFCDKFFKRR